MINEGQFLSVLHKNIFCGYSLVGLGRVEILYLGTHLGMSTVRKYTFE